MEITPPQGHPLLTRHDADVFLEIFQVEEWDGDIVNAAREEHDAWGWFSLDETLSMDLADGRYPALLKEVLT